MLALHQDLNTGNWFQTENAKRFTNLLIHILKRKKYSHGCIEAKSVPQRAAHIAKTIYIFHIWVKKLNTHIHIKRKYKRIKNYTETGWVDTVHAWVEKFSFSVFVFPPRARARNEIQYDHSEIEQTPFAMVIFALPCFLLLYFSANLIKCYSGGNLMTYLTNRFVGTMAQMWQTIRCYGRLNFRALFNVNTTSSSEQTLTLYSRAVCWIYRIKL